MSKIHRHLLGNECRSTKSILVFGLSFFYILVWLFWPIYSLERGRERASRLRKICAAAGLPGFCNDSSVSVRLFAQSLLDGDGAKRPLRLPDTLPGGRRQWLAAGRHLAQEAG